MLKLGILGYGKMGKAIDQLAESQGVETVWRISRGNAHACTPTLLRQADVVIEFSRPEAAFENVMACLEAGLPVVSGTTGWATDLPKAEAYCRQNNGALVWASNFSIGVNLFFALNRYLAKLMSNQDGYQPALTETHHIHKLDAPSGTALTLVQDLMKEVSRFKDYQMVEEDRMVTIQDDEIPITSLRLGEVPGTHHISWKGVVDEISIEHRADSRKGFALGAITAAKWLVDKHGIFTMSDVLNIR